MEGGSRDQGVSEFVVRVWQRGRDWQEYLDADKMADTHPVSVENVPG